MGFLDVLSDAVSGFVGGVYIAEADDKYYFADFGDATSCCDDIEATDVLEKAAGYGAAMIKNLRDLHSSGVVDNAYIVKIYGYCNGMGYSTAKRVLANFMDSLYIRY